jgi:hypothetical protein
VQQLEQQVAGLRSACAALHSSAQAAAAQQGPQHYLLSAHAGAVW